MGPRKGPRPEANPRPIFQGLVIAVTGFKGGEWNETNMSKWISLRKGRLSSQMDASVTHLICSEEDVKNKHPKVREAQKRGIKNCKLVTLDWLEDSMHAKRVLPEGDFSPQKALLKAKKIEARKKQVEKGFEQAVKTVNTNLYHHYQDHTYFTYVVTLRRDHVAPGERYVLFLEESNNSKPHLYWFFAKYYKNKGNTYAHVYRPSFTSGLFQREFDHFKSFFKTKTGIDWDDRLIKEGMAPTDKKFFHYTSPTGGKPVGWVPPGNEKPDPPSPLANPSLLNLDDLDLQQQSSIAKEAASEHQLQQQQQHEEEEDQQPPSIEMLENHDQLHNTMETEAEEMEAAGGGVGGETSSSTITTTTSLEFSPSGMGKRCADGVYLRHTSSDDNNSGESNNGEMEMNPAAAAEAVVVVVVEEQREQQVVTDLTLEEEEEEEE